MHVDGFRFDLAPVLARELFEVDRLSAFFDIIHQDPVLSQVKLIAEPWDVGPGGYQVGNFPVGWAEWNGKYRDAIRTFWKGEEGQIPEVASRLSGSADLYQWTHRAAYASVNFVTAHDGFTLRDLVGYEQKHNEANGENNQDGHDENISRNWGIEGETDDPGIMEMRFRAMRNFLATLAFSQGVPMLSHGDEIGRTQKGNNNAYCQDNEVSWVDWNLDERQRQLLAFTRSVLAIRHTNPVLRRRTFFRGEVIAHEGIKDLTWIRADGQEMAREDWEHAWAHSLGMLVHGDATDETDDRGRPIRGDTMLLLLNASEGDVQFTLPAVAGLEGNGGRSNGGARSIWTMLINTASSDPQPVDGGSVALAPYSLMLLRFGVDRRLSPGGHPAAVNAAAVSQAGEGVPAAAVAHSEAISAGS
jgi:glycogen operon protein